MADMTLNGSMAEHQSLCNLSVAEAFQQGQTDAEFCRA